MKIDQLKKPYLLFLGDISAHLDAKTALGLAHWRPEWCVGQLRLSSDTVDCGLPDLSIEQAIQQGAKSLVVGVAPTGGAISHNWLPVFSAALEQGLDVISGLHTRLAEIPALAAKQSHTATIYDVRHPQHAFPCGNAIKRRGHRLLTVGTDACSGKKFTALAIERRLKALGWDAEFRATGQTGLIIAERGVVVDALVADFVSGAAEWLSPDNNDQHWDIIEGQGSLFHPSFAGVTTGLIHGSQPDALVLCHEHTRTHNMDCHHIKIPQLTECIDLYTRTAKLTNPQAQFIGISLNTNGLSAPERSKLCQQYEAETGLPCFDPLLDGIDKLLPPLNELSHHA